MKWKRPDFKIGVDIVYIPRVREILNSEQSESFLNRCFSKDEIKESLKKKKKEEYLAGRFALKESLIKLLGNREGIQFSEISCIYASKIPTLSFYGYTSKIFKYYEIFFSISHDNEYAFAVAIGRRKR